MLLVSHIFGHGFIKHIFNLNMLGRAIIYQLLFVVSPTRAFTLSFASIKPVMTATTTSPEKGSVYDRQAYLVPKIEDRPKDEIDYSAQKGPKLKYMWVRRDDDDPDSPLLEGQCLYLGGEVGLDGKIYYIPGHAPRVLQLDPTTDEIRQIGPRFPGQFKWLRSIRVGDVMYGLPCNHDSVLRIHVPTETVTLLNIPYEEFFADDPEMAKKQRNQEWKYHGGNQSELDGCIYAIPQSATHVLKIDPKTEEISLFGPSLPGRWKWYGGLIGMHDGAIYGVPQNAST